MIGSLRMANKCREGDQLYCKKNKFVDKHKGCAYVVSNLLNIMKKD